MTENHQYNTPKKGSTDWHIPLNENFKLIDSDVEIRDSDANKGSYTPKSGAKFLATDTGRVYVGDGSQWEFFGNINRSDGDLLVQDTEPQSPSVKDVWIDTGNAGLNVWTSSGWLTIAGTGPDSGGSSGDDVTTSTGTVFDAETNDLSAFGGEDLTLFELTSDSSLTIDGSRSLMRERTNGDNRDDNYRTIASVSGLPVYPSVGDTFRCDVRIDTANTYGGVLWGVQNTGSVSNPEQGYRIRIDAGASPGVEMERVTETRHQHNIDSLSSLSAIETEVSTGQVYTLEVTWNSDGTMPYTIYNSDGSVFVEDQNPTADTTWTSGGIGFMYNESYKNPTTQRAVYDNYEIV
ncbi:hypothetical protein N0B31_19995 [Salinirubellus salinus]|uniref:Uncharacterized protein n=1 Tax=Salinirubellus salinus TaxID=1364945 RepID=A0A9E7R2E9_9EURY|nr:hypothetical protein [Salinirubellus salinus]UWM54387.1 hypothetical protein N0B31_19995 [Salinirubellus salinus]